MLKIMVMGPQELLLETLTLIQQLGIMQVDEKITIGREEDGLAPIPQLLDKESVLQHQLYEKLIKKIDELLTCLSPPSFKHQGEIPAIAIETLVSIVPSHLAETRKRKEAVDELNRQVAEYEAYKVFVDALGGLEDGRIQTDVQCIGVQFEKQEDIAVLQEFLEREYKSKGALESVSSVDGKTTIGVIIVEMEEAGNVRRALEERRMTLFRPPDGMDGLGFSAQQKSVVTGITEKKKHLALLRQQQESFADQWYHAYQQTRSWIESRLSLIKLTATVVKTRMCFFIHGWLPDADFDVLKEKLQERFQGRVVAEENELVEQDFSRIPTALHNPAYFEPFELFTRLLPMPPYASFDMTPFIGIFFPVFFGMMLGDIGYGLILLAGSVFLVRRFKTRKNLRDAGKILFISSLYTMVFGLLYGEFLGTVGHMHLGLKPILFDRQASIIPMLCFAIAMGVVHVIIGLVLGVIISLRRKMKKVAVIKLVNIFIILCICILVVSHFTQSMAQIQKPLLMTIVVVTPVLLLVGGLMAPLELLKNVGNIISYARIMAVGMTTVLLAFVANYMVGRIGSVWAGICVAVMLHVFNLLLGVFAPTIHSLRLHYVEFLSKFMEPGGKEFKPLAKKH
jgi:V/A-type H+-transporting ATPase subunit I